MEEQLAESEIRPMLAFSQSEIFDSPDYIYEALWEGIRCLAFLDSRGTSLRDRHGEDITWRFPELANLNEQLLVQEAIVDGEIVVLAKGRPSEEFLQIRERATDEQEVARMSSEMPALFVAFDLLRRNGKNTVGLPLLERKELLKTAVRQSRVMVLGSWIEEKGSIFLAKTSRLGMEGVVAKKKQSPYIIGQRSSFWLKVRRSRVQDCVICGYTAGSGRREGILGSLVLGAYLGDKLVHVGNVGSGFTDQSLRAIGEEIKPLTTDVCPFAEPPVIERATTWVKPEIVCEVEYAEWTSQQKLRSPRFVQLRLDKRAADCQIEDISLLK